MVWIGCVGLAPFFAGCAVRDVVWSLLGSHYSEGGYTEHDKRRHFDQAADEAERVDYNR
jgi:hypothetical protein